MKRAQYTYRKVNPSSIQDINKYLEIQKQLKNFLNCATTDLTA